MEVMEVMAVMEVMEVRAVMKKEERPSLLDFHKILKKNEEGPFSLENLRNGK